VVWQAPDDEQYFYRSDERAIHLDSRGMRSGGLGI
jgi:hypothetical protein